MGTDRRGERLARGNVEERADHRHRLGPLVECRVHRARLQEGGASGVLEFAFDVSRATVALAAGDAEAALAAALVGAALPHPAHMAWWLMPLAAQALADLTEDDRRAQRDPSVNLVRVADLRQRFPTVILQADEQPIPGDLVVPALTDRYEAEVGRARRQPDNDVQWAQTVESCHAATLVWEEAYACWRTAESLLRTTTLAESKRRRCFAEDSVWPLNSTLRVTFA